MEELHGIVRDRRLALLDRVIAGLTEQGELSADDESCRYRTETKDGRTLRCAAGWLISDEFYSSALERNDVTQDIVQNALRRSGIRNKDLFFVADLQEIHDKAFNNHMFLKGRALGEALAGYQALREQLTRGGRDGNDAARA